MSCDIVQSGCEYSSENGTVNSPTTKQTTEPLAKIASAIQGKKGVDFSNWAV